MPYDSYFDCNCVIVTVHSWRESHSLNATVSFEQVSGTVDGAFKMGLEGQHRSDRLAEAQAAAHAKAVQAGADPSTCKVKLFRLFSKAFPMVLANESQVS